MKRPSNELFLLIKSLTSKEKRYFKLYTSMLGSGEGKIYVQLFDVIDKMTSYDEALLKKKYQHESFLHQLPSNKNYLFQTILKSLSNFYGDTSGNMYLLDLLRKVELLFQRGLFDSCEKMVKTGKKLSSLSENHTIHGLFLQWEIKMSLNSANPKRAINILDQQTGILEKQIIDDKYRKACFLMNAKAMQSGYSHTENTVAEADKIHREFGLYKLHPSSDCSAKHFFYTANNIYYLLINKPFKRVFFVEKMVANLESQKFFLQSNPGYYIGALLNYCDAFLKVGQAARTMKAIQKMRNYAENLDASYGVIKSYVVINTLGIEINAYNITNQTEKAIALEDTALKIIEEYVYRVAKSNIMDLIFNMSYSFFINNQYSKAIDWLNKIKEQYQLGYREDLYIAARILLLIAHYEKGDYLFLDKTAEAVIKYLKIKNQLGNGDKVLLQFLEKASRGKLNVRNELLGLKKIFMNRDNANNALIIKYVDVDCWIESKINGTPLSEVIRNKYLRLSRRGTGESNGNYLIGFKGKNSSKIGSSTS